MTIKDLEPIRKVIAERAEKLGVAPYKLFASTVLEMVEEIINKQS